MRYSLAPLSYLVPTQFYIYPNKMNNLGICFEAEKIKPIPVLSSGGRFLMGDGHHRAATLWLYSRAVGKEVRAPIQIVESNEDIRDYFAGSHSKYDLDTFEETYGLQNTLRRSYLQERIENVWFEESVCNCASLNLCGREVFRRGCDKTPFFKIPKFELIDRALVLFQGFELALAS